MAQNVYKSKSFNKEEYSDEEIETKCGTVRFMSFERACNLYSDDAYDIKDRPIGYRVTDQGIEILY